MSGRGRPIDWHAIAGGAAVVLVLLMALVLIMAGVAWLREVRLR